MEVTPRRCRRLAAADRETVAASVMVLGALTLLGAATRHGLGDTAFGIYWTSVGASVLGWQWTRARHRATGRVLAVLFVVLLLVTFATGAATGSTAAADAALGAALIASGLLTEQRLLSTAGAAVLVLAGAVATIEGVGDHAAGLTTGVALLTSGAWGTWKSRPPGRAV